MPSSGMRPSRPPTATPARTLVTGTVWTCAAALTSAVALQEIGLPETSWPHGLIVGAVVGISLTLTVFGVIRTARQGIL